jgi:hypothetical protein
LPLHEVSYTWSARAYQITTCVDVLTTLDRHHNYIRTISA